MKKFAKYVYELKTIEKDDYNSIFESLNDKYPKELSNDVFVSMEEKLFYEELYKNGIKAVPQYRVEMYRLDLAIKINNKKLDIEIDGCDHIDGRFTKERCYSDKIRNQRLFELGWDVIRLWNHEVNNDLDNCITKIKDWINSQ